MSEKSSSVKVLPVLFGFFVMGFCDVVGIATSYVKQDFGLSETVAGFIPSMVFIWFLLISVPSAMWMNRVGRKTMVQLSNAVTFVGMLIPFVHYSFASCMAGFVLLGVGNTMLQVSLNPLLTNVVSGARLTSMLTAGQVIKAVSSFCGPFIAAFAVSVFGEWRYLFPIFAAVTLLSMIWLMFTDVKREAVSSGTSDNGRVRRGSHPSCHGAAYGPHRQSDRFRNCHRRMHGISDILLFLAEKGIAIHDIIK